MLKQAEILKPDLVIVTGILPLKKDIILTIKRNHGVVVNYLTDDPWNPIHRREATYQICRITIIYFQPNKHSSIVLNKQERQAAAGFRLLMTQSCITQCNQNQELMLSLLEQGLRSVCLG